MNKKNINPPAIHRPSKVNVFIDRINENINNIIKFSGAEEMIAVIKSNAYGLGAVEISNSLEKNSNVSEFAVSNIDEAIELRENNVKKDVWVFGASDLKYIDLFIEYNLIITIKDLKQLKELEKQVKNLRYKNKTIKIAIPVETGMNRIGIQNIEELKEALNIIKNNNSFVLKEVYSHFSSADERETNYTEFQIKKWNKMTEELDIDDNLISFANSSAVLFYNNNKEIPKKRIRVGEIIYGGNPNHRLSSQLKLKPTFELVSEIIDIRHISKGESISYGHTFKPKEDSLVATVPIGYADGWFRKMQGSKVLVNDKFVPIVGRITMDFLLIPVSQKEKVGDKVILIGSNENGKQITVEEQADYLETIPYELQTSLSSRIPRFFIKEEKNVKEN